MPTFTAIAFENLLEPTVEGSLKKLLHGDPRNQRNGGPRHLYISPSLYATPEQTPIPEYPPSDPLSPSPYLVNLKRRRGGNERRNSRAPELPDLSLEENLVNQSLVGIDDVDVDVGEEEDEGFEDPRSEAVSVGSEAESACDLNRNNQNESRSFVSAQGEFFDAIDEFSSDGSVSSIPSYDSRIESELHASRIHLCDETERRKAAEEALSLMHSQWDSIRNLMSEAGLTFPAPPADSDSMELENNLDQISQEVVITRFVAEAVGRGKAHAEAEEVMSAIIELKDQEISRLRDRLQYYETVNHEMSQRKLVEVACRQQERKRSRRRWLWGFMGLSVAIGASFVAYTYIPRTSEYLSLLKFGDSTDDASSINVSETSQE